MKNWSHTTLKFDKKTPEYQIWKLEQLINFGIEKEKLSRHYLKKYFSKLNIDPDKKRYLAFLLKTHQNEKHSHKKTTTIS
jgi:hypothetical protein